MIADTLSNIDLDAELTMFLCSVIAFFVLTIIRNKWLNQSCKAPKRMKLEADEPDAHSQDDDASYAQTDAALQTAFENEDYWTVLQCWGELKYLPQSSIHLPTVIRSMRSCNKGAYFIVGELKNFFKTHPTMLTIGFINELLEPMTRRSGDAQLVDLLVRMIPSLNIVKDSRSYEILLTMYASNGNLTKAQEIVAEMQTQEIKFSPCATASVLNMGLQMGNLDVVLKAFIKLKASWDVRTTWAVSMFAVEGHKSSVLMKIVELAFQKHKIAELSPSLVGMIVPEEVLEVVQAKIAQMDDIEVATNIALLEESGKNLKVDAIYNTLTCSSKSRSKTSAPWRTRQRADSDASTSEGSRSDSEECRSPPPGLASPPGL